MKTIWLIIPILVFISSHLQAQVTVEPLSVQVSKLPADVFGHALHPFSSKDKPGFFLSSVAPNSGTRLFLLITLPAGKVVPLSSKAAPTHSLPKGLEVKSLTDSTGQNLLKPDPNAAKRDEFFPDNKPITLWYGWSTMWKTATPSPKRKSPSPSTSEYRISVLPPILPTCYPCAPGK